MDWIDRWVRRLALFEIIVVTGMIPSLPSALADPLPDLTILSLQAPTAFTNGPNPFIPVSWAVTNLGGSLPSIANWVDTVYLSGNSVLDATATPLALNGLSAEWLASGSYAITNGVGLPITNSGTWYLHLRTDDLDQIAESNEANNTATLQFTATILPPDLGPLALVSPTSLSGPPLPYLTLSWGVTNQGPGPADGFAHPWVDNLWLSTNSYRDGTEQPVGYSLRTNKVDPGGSYWVTNRVRLPVTQSGNYYLILEVAPENNLLESNTNNNTVKAPLAFTATPPDLAPVLFQAPASFTGTPRPSLTLTWGVTNQGTGPAVGQIGTVYGLFDGWLDGFYLSTNAVLDATATRIDSWAETNALAPGASYFRTNTFTLPVVASGDYFLFLVTDDFNDLQESNFNNNTASRAITLTIQPSDLAPLPIVGPTTVTGEPGTLVSIIVGVTNQGVGAAINSFGAWYDQLQLWTTPSFPGQSWYQVLDQWTRTKPVSPGASYWLTNSFAIPQGGGAFTLVFKADIWDNLFESNETNNTVSSPFTLMIPPRVANPALGSDGSFSGYVFATLGFNYTLQASSNLVDWVNVSTFNCDSWPTAITEAGASTHPRRFYRLATEPTQP